MNKSLIVSVILAGIAILFVVFRPDFNYKADPGPLNRSTLLLDIMDWFQKLFPGGESLLIASLSVLFLAKYFLFDNKNRLDE